MLWWVVFLFVGCVDAASLVWIRPRDHGAWLSKTVKPLSWDGSDGGWVLVPQKLADHLPITERRNHTKVRRKGKNTDFVVAVATGSRAADVSSLLRQSLPNNVKTYATANDRFLVRFPRNANKSLLESSLSALENRGDVLWVHERPKIVLHTVYASMDIIGLGSPDVLVEGSNVTILVADTGLDVTHCMFASGITPPQGYLAGTPITLPDTGSKVRGYLSLCLDTGCTTTTDFADLPNGHGTHVSGISLGASCLSKYGLQPSSRCLFVDMSTTADGIDLPVSLSAMFASGASMGASASTFSWGTTANDGSYEDISSQLDDILNARPTWVAAVAGGNAGGSGGSGSDPATAKNVLSVGAVMLGATAYADGSRGYDPTHVATYPYLYNPTSVASFTSMGPWVGGRNGPLVCAPGVALLSAAAGSGTGFILMTGTSMAAPAVPLGAVQKRLSDALGTGMPRSSLVRAAIIATAYDATRVVTLYSSTVQPDASQDPRSRCAFGVVNANPLLETTNWMAASVSLGTQLQYVCVVATGTTVSVALAWNEPGAVPGTTQPVLNNVLLWATANGTYEQDTIPSQNHRRVRLSGLVLGQVVRIGLNPTSIITGPTLAVDMLVFNATTQVGCQNDTCIPQPCGDGSCYTTCPNNTCICTSTFPPTAGLQTVTVVGTDPPENSYLLVLVVSLEVILAITLFGGLMKDSQSIWSVFVLAAFLVFVVFAAVSADMDPTVRLNAMGGLYAVLVVVSFGTLAVLPANERNFQWLAFIVVLWVSAMFVFVLTDGFFQAAGLFTLLTAIMLFALGYSVSPWLTVFITLLLICFYSVVVAATLDLSAPYAGLYLAGCIIIALAAAGGVADYVFEVTRKKADPLSPEQKAENQKPLLYGQRRKPSGSKQ